MLCACFAFVARKPNALKRGGKVPFLRWRAPRSGRRCRCGAMPLSAHSSRLCARAQRTAALNAAVRCETNEMLANEKCNLVANGDAQFGGWPSTQSGERARERP